MLSTDNIRVLLNRLILILSHMKRKSWNCKYNQFPSSAMLLVCMYLYLQIESFIFLIIRGDEMYPTANSLGYGGLGEVSKEGMDRMLKDLDRQ